MLKIHVDATKLFDEDTETFIDIKECNLRLEHSLISLRKWEQKYHKPFLTEDAKTEEESLYYYECMCLDSNVDPNIFKGLSSRNIKDIWAYIEDSSTATWFSTRQKKDGVKPKKEVITAEIIYYWMIELNIPPEYEKWHLNQLMTLIRVINIKQAAKTKNGKMSKRETLDYYNRLNRSRSRKGR